MSDSDNDQIEYVSKKARRVEGGGAALRGRPSLLTSSSSVVKKPLGPAVVSMTSAAASATATADSSGAQSGSVGAGRSSTNNGGVINMDSFFSARADVPDDVDEFMALLLLEEKVGGGAAAASSNSVGNNGKGGYVYECSVGGDSANTNAALAAAVSAEHSLWAAREASRAACGTAATNAQRRQLMVWER